MRDETPDLPLDAPLRHRVWWGFWRGWKVLITAIVVLAFCGYATNPTLYQHWQALGPAVGVDLGATRRPPVAWGIVRMSDGLTRVDLGVLSLGRHPTSGELRTLGLLGMVWVLE